MARWDEILSLPVQSPPSLEFSSADLTWSRVEGWRDTIDRVALIPFDRVDDFVRGESSNKDCPTRFHVEARRRRPPQMAYKPKVDGILEYILYWCSFGPDDHRKGGVVRPSRVYNYKKKTPAGRPNTKRGCVCHFIVKRLIAEPTVALIIYNQEKHVDKKGLPCHGPLDKKAAGTRAMFAPYISDELRLRVLSLLYVGVPVETIMQRHNESVEKQGGPCNRDDLLTHRYVRRLERSIRRSTFELDPDDAISISMWVESHQSHIFYYEDFSDSEPFVLGIQTEWQLQQMIRFGNRSLMVSDSRFGTNKLKYPVHSLLVFNSNNKAIPIAWIITPRFATADAYKWITALYNRVHSKDPTWKLAGFIVDDPSTDILTIREVFRCSISICFWRVRHAWHKNLVAKCSETETRADIMRRLGQAINGICKENADLNSFEDFMEDFIDCTDFLDYFKAIWFPRMGIWTKTLKTLPLASQETCSAIESYHHQFKLRLLNEKDTSVFQRVDWLVDKLGTKVHSYYWLDEYTGKDDFARYRKDEWKSGLTSWSLAVQIPDSDVVLESRCAKVTSQHNREKAHTVWNPGSEFALCECSWSRLGNLCKHVIKASQFYRRRGLAASSINLFEYNQILINMLHCAPHDSLIRDHAVTLAVCAQRQLSMIFDPEDRTCQSIPIEQPIINGGASANETSENIDKDLMDGSQCVNGNLSSNSNGSGIPDTVQVDDMEVAGDCNNVNDALGNIADDVGNPEATEAEANNGVCGVASEETASGKVMDIDPEFDASEETAAGKLMDIDPQSTSSSSLIEQQSVNDIPENGKRHSIKKSNCMSVSPYGKTIGNEAGDHISDVAYGDGDKAIELRGNENGLCGDIAEAVTGSEMIVDLQSVRASPSSTETVEQQKIVDLAANHSVISGSITAETIISNNDVEPYTIQTSPTGLEPVEQQRIVDIDATDEGVCSSVAEEGVAGDAMDVDLQPIGPYPSMSVSTEKQSASNHVTSEDAGGGGAVEHTVISYKADIKSVQQTVVSLVENSDAVCGDVAKEIVTHNSANSDAQAV